MKLKHSKIYETKKNQIVMKQKNSFEIKLKKSNLRNSKAQIAIKCKNINCDETEKLKL